MQGRCDGRVASSGQSAPWQYEDHIIELWHDLPYVWTASFDRSIHAYIGTMRVERECDERQETLHNQIDVLLEEASAVKDEVTNCKFNCKFLSPFVFKYFLF